MKGVAGERSINIKDIEQYLRVEQSESNSLTVKHYYDTDIEDERIYNMLFKDGENYKCFWLASHDVHDGQRVVCCVENGKISYKECKNNGARY